MEKRTTHFRFIVIAMLFFIMVTNYIDRAAISFAIGDMARLFHLDSTSVGIILGAFGIGYAFTTLFGGLAVDRLGSRLTLTAAVLLWSLAVIFSGFIMGFWMAFFMRLLLGVAEGPNFPVMSKSISNWLPEKERMTATSYACMAVPIALAIGGPIVTQLIAHFSWQWMFFILGITALIWVPIWWYFFSDHPKDSPRVNEAELQQITQDDPQETASFSAPVVTKAVMWRYMLTNPTLLANYWAFFVFGYYLFFFMGWLPTYLTHQYHLELTKVGLFTVLPWLLAAGLMWCFGYFGDYILQRTGNYRWSRSYPIIVSQLLAAVCIIPIIITANLMVAMIFISLAVGFSMSANAAYFVVNIDVAKARTGAATGLMEFCFALSGFLAPSITGVLVTLTGHFDAAFSILAGLGLSTAVVVFLFHHPGTTRKLGEEG